MTHPPLDADRLGDLQGRLAAVARPSVRAWWTRYLKGEAAFRGVRMADTRRIVRRWWVDSGLDEAGGEVGVGAALSLIRQRHTEDKLAGMLVLGELLIPAAGVDRRRDLDAFAALFDGGHLADWNAVDWFCVKVLGPLCAALEGESRAACVESIGQWRTAPILWRRRASAVAFVNLVGRGDAFTPGFVATVLASCTVLVASPERFSQTGAGWVLRELSVVEPERVRSFLDEFGESMSAEARASARRKLQPA